jgi:transcriptional regulator with XRE-family HTH domain
MTSPGEEQIQEIKELRSGLAEKPGVADIAGRIAQAEARRDSLLHAMARFRTERGLSQQRVAGLMATSQPAVARLEAGLLDPRLSTLERYAAAIGYELNLGGAAQMSPGEADQEATTGTVGETVAQWLKSGHGATFEKYENPILRLMVMSEEAPHKVVGYMTVQPMEHGLKLNALASKPDVILDAVKGVIRESGQSVEVRLDTQPEAET